MEKEKTLITPLLPLRGLLIFPTMVLHLDVGRKNPFMHWNERCWKVKQSFWLHKRK